jgi:inner membrane protein
MTWWIWIILGFFLLICEIITPGGFYIVFFGIGALIVGLLLVLGIPIVFALQIVIFVILSVVLLLLFSKRLRQRFAKSDKSDKVDKIAGEFAHALEDIPQDAFGKVELRGAPWNAKNTGDAKIAKGQRCVVESMDGLTLFIKLAN